MKNRTLLASTLLLSLCGCSKFLDKFSRETSLSRVRFNMAQTGSLNSRISLNGGIIIYAVNADNDSVRTIQLANDTDLSTFNLPNGHYHFVAAGWPTTNLGGALRCGTDNTATPIPLNGTIAGQDPIPITISMTPSACLGSIFSDAVFNNSSNLYPPEITFCDSATDVSTFSTSSPDCSNGQASPSFKKAGTPSGTNPKQLSYDTGSGRFTYLADTYGLMELFSTDKQGSFTVRQNPNLHPTTDSARKVNAFQNVPDGSGRAVYSSDEEYATPTHGVFQLYITKIGVQGSTKLSVGSLPGGLTTSDGVKTFQITDDGKYVIFAESVAASGPTELYAVDISGTPPYVPTKISQTSPPGSGLINTAFAGWELRLLPDKLHAVYSGKFASSTKAELFLVDIPTAITTPGSGITTLHTGASTGYTATELRLNFNGTKLVWKANVSGSQVFAWACDLSTPGTPGTPVQLSAGTSQPYGSDSITSGIWLSDNADLAAYSSDPTTSGTNQLWVTNFSNLGGLTQSLTDSGGAGQAFSFVQFTPDNLKVVYLKGSTPSAMSLYRSTLTNSTRALSPTLSTLFNQSSITNNPFQIVDNLRVTYVGDTGANPGHPRVLESWTDASANLEVDVSAGGSTTAAGSVKGFGPGYNRGFFSIDDSGASAFLPYMLTFGSNPGLDTRTALPAGPFTSVDNISMYKEGSSVAFLANAVFLEGRLAVSAPKDIYAYYDFNSAAAPVKLTHIDGGAGGSGRYQIHILAYNRDGAAVQVLAPAFSSDCLNLTVSNSDGGSTTHGLQIPYGNTAAPNPFAVQIEVFPNADDCSGTNGHTLYTFPKGLANFGAATSSQKVKLVTTSTPHLFLAD